MIIIFVVDCKGVGLFALKVMGSNLEGLKRDLQDFFFKLKKKCDLFICKTFPTRKQATCSLKEKWLTSLMGEPGSIPGRSRCIKDFF